MRWQSLFDDLEAQLRIEAAEQFELRADEERQRLGRMSLRDRLSALADADESVRVRTIRGDVLEVSPDRFGRDWMTGTLASATGSTAVVLPLGGLAGVLLPADSAVRSIRTQAPRGGLSDRLGLAVILRELSRRRIPVDVTTSSARVTGTIDRVGSDHFDLALHEAGAARRRDAVRGVELVPFAALVSIVC